MSQLAPGSIHKFLTGETVTGDDTPIPTNLNTAFELLRLAHNDTDIKINDTYTKSAIDTKINGLKSGADITAGAINATHIADGVVTLTEMSLTSLDSRYYTETELNNGQLDSRYFTETELNTGQLDTRYYTETELLSPTSGSSGATKIGATPIATSPSTVQGILEWLKNQMDSTVLGQIPDGAVTPVKLSFDPATQTELDTVITDLNTHKSNITHIPFGTTTGPANVYAVTLTPAPTSYTDGMPISVKINIDATAASTINVNGLGAKSLKKHNGSDVTNLKVNGVYTFRYNSTTGNFIIQGEGGGGTAVAADLLSGKTAAVDSGDITGSMINRGAMSISAGSTAQTIPVGYHNGSGSVPAVTFDATKVLTGTTIAGTAGTMVNRNAGANPATSVGQWPDGGLAVYLEGGYYAPGAGPGEVKVTSAQLQSAEGDLVAANIVSGKNIYGIVGTFAGVDLINISAPSAIGENSTTATVKKSVTMSKAGNVTVRAGMRNPNVNGDVYGYFRKNAVQFPPGVYGIGTNQTPAYWSATISVVPGDVIDVVTYSSNGGAYNAVQELTIVTTMPSSPTGGTVTLGA